MWFFRKKPVDFPKARQLAQKIFEDSYVDYPPVYASDVANTLFNIDVQTVALADSRTAGYIETEQSKPVIYINVRDSDPLKNFTAAYALGHILLGYLEKDHDPTFYYEDRDKIMTSCEQEINCFAANLIVPLTLFRRRYREFWGLSNRDFSIMFNSPIDVIRHQKRYL